ncbi:CaiB/BaiF CoA transferase family protein [Blastomonas fulva]|jgi:crotonobetainyl-CoA:carnitine CoA-transferase CaiB-like acyl-CoA transferase|uniref:Carnitine dehydratase n=1 Tax=Blastomonas fulva TaxID=1550728 RepID=A0ABM6M764_9SPHN|nr:CoA transferase [Blastomonas fulva]ASR51758.1 carnitine dehydratase [Blastomonas fulva]
MAESIWKTSEIAATGPLAGVRVLDMSSVVMGPLATLMLADMGADVIKVENRGGSHSGDMMRYAGSSPTGDLGPIFMALNRNKKAVTIDGRDELGKAQLETLLKDADVFFHNVRMAGMARLGLDYESVKAINPGIIYIHCCGYGAEGPYAKRQAYDDLVQAASGWADLYAKRSGGDPSYTPSLVADKTVGLFATTATLAALVHKERTGHGQFVSVPMFECFTFFNMVENLYGQTFPGDGKFGYTRSMNPRRRPYPTKDGFIAIVPYVDRQWERFFEIGGRPGVFQDPRFSTYEERTRHTGDLYAIIEEVAATKTTDEWVELLDKEDIPAMRFNRIEDVPSDPHLAATGFFMDAHAPHIGDYRTLRHPIAFAGSPVNQRLAPQCVGAQNHELPGAAND